MEFTTKNCVPPGDVHKCEQLGVRTWEMHLSVTEKDDKGLDKIAF